MKKFVSLLIAVAMLLSICTVTAFAGEKPEGPVLGPTEDFHPMAGGSRIGFSDFNSYDQAYVLSSTMKGGLEVDNEAFPGATYDMATNTLTLKDLDAADHSLFIWFMGEDFKINVEGECSIGVIFVSNYFAFRNTCLTITGTGSLTVNENKTEPRAINMLAEGEGQDMTLTVEAGVTLDLYASDADDSYVIYCGGTSVESADKAVTIGGAPVEGMQSEREVAFEHDYINVIAIDDPTAINEAGYAVKSKTDPDGVYAASWWSDEYRFVSRYIYIPEIDMVIADPTFGDYEGDSGKSMSTEEFEEQYEYMMSDQPVKILFTDDERESDRGWELFKVEKEGEPGEVYAAGRFWDGRYDEENPTGYNVYHLIWDADENIYRRDEAFSPLDLTAEEFEESGFSIVTEEVEDINTITVIDPDSAIPSQTHLLQVKYFEDPNGLYGRTSTYESTSQGEIIDSGIIIKPISYDADGDYYYIPEGTEGIYITGSDVGTVCEYVYAAIKQKVKVKYITNDYGFEDYATEAFLMTNSNEPGQLYAGVRVRFDYGGVIETHYTVYKIEYREEAGHYYAQKLDDSDEHYYAIEVPENEMAEKGYSFVLSEQNTPFETVGSATAGKFIIYHDKDGKTYTVRWNDLVYYLSDENTVKIGGKTYYIGEYRSDIAAEDLTSSTREVETDQFDHWLPLTEYHYKGTGSSGVLVGDLNADEKVNNRDAMILDRYVAGWDGYDKNIKSFDAADLNRDKQVNNRDAMILDRYVAGWNGYDKYIITV